jgi:hypothetical protein
MCGMVVRALDIDDEQLSRMLRDCRFPRNGQRPGFVPFNAPCVAARLVEHRLTTASMAMAELGRLARELGGEVVEGEVLWLPEW